MVFFNYALRKLNAKIVYYGPGLCGKTTNLAWIHDHFEGGAKGKMISLATEGDRTIFFDLLPLEIGAIRGMDVTLQLYTVPGQVHYNSTRQLVLRGADGVVFVADSQRTMQSSNIDSFKNLQENLLLQGISLDGFPLVLQFNKRDLKDIVPIEEMNHDLNRYTVPIFEATATEGVGVQETLEGIVKLVMRSLRERYEGAVGGARPGMTDEAARATPPVSVPPSSRASHRPPPTTQQPVRPPAAAPPPQAGAPPPDQPVAPVTPSPTAQPPAARPPVQPPAAQPPVQAPPPAARPPAAQPPVQPPPPAEQPPVRPPAPVAQTPVDPQLPAPKPPVEPLPPAIEPPSVDVFSPDPNAQNADLFKTQGPEMFGQHVSPGFEDEVSTDVYEVGSQEAADAAAGLLGGEPFGEIPTDPKMQAPATDDVPVSGVSAGPPAQAMPPDEVLISPDLDVSPAVPPTEPDEFELDYPGSEPEAPAPVAEAPPAVETPAPVAEAPPAVESPHTFEAAPFSEAEFPSDADQAPPPAFETPLQAEPLPAAEPVDVEQPPPPLQPVPGGGYYEDQITAPSPFAPQPGDDHVVSPDLFAAPPVDMPAVIGPDAEEIPMASGVEDVSLATDVEELPRTDEAVEPIEVPAFVDAPEDVGEVRESMPVDDLAAAVNELGMSEPVVESGFDPFAEPEPVKPEPEPEVPAFELEMPSVVELDEPEIVEPVVDAAAIEPAQSREVDVRAQDNQLHLRLQGTGAIVESGQVRELDIEVPVPGAWVGHRRVTLQLRLTLTPDSEEENDGSGGTA